MIPDQEVRIEALISLLTLERAERTKDRAIFDQINARLERIERAHAIPLEYSLREAGMRIWGMGESWSYKNLDKFPKPVRIDPYRFRVADVEAMAADPLNVQTRRKQRSA